VDPSIKMIIFATLPITLQLLFPLFSLILMAAYFKEFVIACIAIITTLNLAVLTCQSNQEYHIKRLYASKDETKMKKMMKKGKQESEEIFLTAIFTSWISPCTVWSNNMKSKSYFLILNSLTTLLGHAVGIVSIFILSYFEVFKMDPLQTKNQPITHCFMNPDSVSLR
jgi:hypothetical protein